MTEGKAAARLRVLAWAVVVMFGALMTRMWFLQVMASDEYRQAADDNRVQVAPIPAARGRILDRNGDLLVQNRTSRVVTVKRSDVENEEALLLKLSRVLGVDADELGERLDDPDYGPFEAIPVAEDVPEETILYLAERQREFPGVDYGTIGVRDYPNGSLAAHILGYLGQINEQELHTPPFRGYRPGQAVGRGGVEQMYERYLHGKDGHQAYEVDARGRRMGRLKGTAPVEGNDVVLTIDRKIQKAAEEALSEGVSSARQIVHEESGSYLKAAAGAVVVLDARDGEVLAMASYPTYDPRAFLEGLTQREWDRLTSKRRNFPLNNRAIQGQYPPGSVLKPFVAAAAVKGGYAHPNGFYPCPPEFSVEGDTSNTVFRNWKDTDSGTISFGQALVESCDTVFYRFGLDFYRERKIRGELLQQHLRAWGYDRPTGIDLPSEVKGRVPDAAWKSIVHSKHPDLFPDPVWYPGDTINMSIGQGDVLATPLQVARSFAALANGGTLVRPHVGLRVQDPKGNVVRRLRPAPGPRVRYGRKLLDRIEDALEGVVTSGTGAHAFSGFPVPVAGKTGTSETPNQQPHSWFAAFAPADRPRYVAVAVVEEGGHGSEVAAPIVRRIMEHLFDVDPAPFRVGIAAD
ncbi:MAG TPA: penicillin-binding protein 2 [Actinomycetota bacterium]|nr:penicillin-binding protein 2 [Actinomycetota bacterium]